MSHSSARAPSPSLSTPLRSHQARRAAWSLGACLVLAVWPLGMSAKAQHLEVIRHGDGVEAWHVSEPSIPLVAIRIALAGGASRDPDGKEGLTALTAALLTEGAADHNAQDFARELAKLGAKLSFTAGRDQLYVNLDALSSRLAPSIELLLQALFTPGLEADAFNRARQQQLADLGLAAAEPGKIAFERWYAGTYPGQRYGRPISGVPTSVGAITLRDVRDHHRRLLTSSCARLVIVGDASGEAARRAIARVASGLSTGPSNNPDPPARPQRLAEPMRIEVQLAQAIAAFGLPVMPPDDPDYPALQVLNQIMGSGDFNSILMEEIRVKRGLAYAISTSLNANSLASVLVGGLSTRNESLSEAVATLQSVLARTSEEGPSADQLEAAKGYLIGSRALDLDGTARRASTLLRLWLQGHTAAQIESGLQSIGQVSMSDIRRVARTVLDWNRINLVIVGPAPAPK